MYAQAVRKPSVPRHGRANNQVRLNMFKGCAFSDVGLDCITYLKLGDPCCGSGGMFVQSAKFVENHSGNINNIAIYGEDSNPTTWKMAQMNLAMLTASLFFYVTKWLRR